MELKTALKIAQLTQLELAERTGVDPAVISRLVSGKQRRPSYEVMVRIARALNVAPDELFPVADVTRKTA